MLQLPNITLIGADCVNFERLQLAADISTKEIEFGAVKLLTSLKTDDKRAVPIDNLLNITDYSVFCLRDLHKYVDTEFALIIQHDGFVLNPGAWDEEFLNYDYIGAPIHVREWAIKKLGVPKDKIPFTIVGNGGFSLRSKKLLNTTADLFDKRILKKVHPEDWIFCYEYRKEFEKRGITYAPEQLAGRFSHEGSRSQREYSDSFGFHSLRNTDISSWLEKHPEWKNSIRNFVVGKY